MVSQAIGAIRRCSPDDSRTTGDSGRESSGSGAQPPRRSTAMFIMIFVGAIKASAGTIGAKRTFVIEHVLDETGGRERGLGVLEPLRIKIRFQANQVKLAPPPPPTLSASPHDLDPS